MSRPARVLVALSLLTLALAGCAAPPPPAPAPSPGPTPAPGPSPSPPGSDATGDGFAWDMLRALRAKEPGKNLFLSPVSVAAALCLAVEGAAGATRLAMAETLGLGAEPEQACRALNAALLRARNASGAQVEVANSVWVRDTFAPRVKPAFLDALRTDFRAGAFVERFDDATVAKLNAWVANATRGMIPGMLDPPLPDDLVLMLANAVYFEGRWQHPFDANLTSPGDFRRSDGRTVQVPTMRNASALNVSLATGEGFRAARLPYADGEHAMYVLLPDPGRSVDDVARGLTDARWSALAAGMEQEREVDLALPKFELAWGGELKDALAGLGMAMAFDPGAADFSRIAEVAPERLYISFVKHKAALEVDEEGTRAAGATVVGVGVTSAPPPPPQFHVDRPFLLAIVDERLGMPLFLGAIEDPAAG